MSRIRWNKNQSFRERRRQKEWLKILKKSKLLIWLGRIKKTDLSNFCFALKIIYAVVKSRYSVRSGINSNSILIQNGTKENESEKRNDFCQTVFYLISRVYCLSAAWVGLFWQRRRNRFEIDNILKEPLFFTSTVIPFTLVAHSVN